MTPTREKPETLGGLVARTEGLQPWRRVFHAASGVAVAAILAWLEPGRLPVVAVLAGATTAAFAFDRLRLANPRLNRLFFLAFRPLASPREAARVASSTWYLLGMTLSLALFPLQVAIAAILVLALADPAASYVGRRWGRRALGGGTVEGSLVFAATAFLVLVPLTGPGPAGAAAVLGAAFETLRWPLDDNLVIPLVAGSATWGASALLGVP